MISIRVVSKSYAGRVVLQPTTLELAQEKTHVFWGSSGSGKSTLLRLICGLCDPTSGHVFIDDKPVSVSRHQELATRIGYVIQEGGLFPHLSARQNLALATRRQSWTRARLESRIAELAQLVRLEVSQLDLYPTQLSGGQRQRVALMRALMLDPSLLLLDEPLGALDPLVRSDLQKELKAIFKELKKTVILVTHDISEGAIFGDTISLFDQGRLVQHGAFGDFFQHPSEDFVTRFVRAQTPPPELLEALRS